MKKIAIIGGGIGGLTLAIALSRKGLNVQVFESAPAFKPLGAGLSLATNAMRALADIGIEKEVMTYGKVIKQMFGKDESGRVISFTDAEKLTARFGVVNNFTIHRADLHQVLIGLLPADAIQLGKTLVDFEQHAGGVKISFADGTTSEVEYLIACDGIHSPARKKLLPGSLPRYAGYTCWRAVVDDLPEGFNENETTETWGRGRRFGVVPLSNKRVYWFATCNAPQNDAAMKNSKAKELQTMFSNFHFPVPQILARTKDEQIIWSDIIDIKPVRQFAFGRILLMGDAAHATTPNLGQGACMAIEDAATLSNGLTKYSPEEAFVKFEKHRIKRTTAIVNQSWNFGNLAQWENPLMIRIRNGLLRVVPQSVIDKQVKNLYDVTFNY
ncbi:MAG TPA: FAD-dependent monooxygenase [Cyclobacteriaceae bacterium]|nr:FAD-dependent monooxygenase [Cyclobacteriaceae bacterium]